MSREQNVAYPVCIAGKRKCPPEDCGGADGYRHLLAVIGNKKHKEYDEMIGWLCGDFDPEAFDPNKIVFDDPEMRWEMAFE